MKKIAFVAAAFLTLSVAAGPAKAQSRPGGCLKYGLGGAVAGHFAGGHRVKGALAGCVMGMYQRRKYEREAREGAQRNRTAERRRGEPLSDLNRSRPNTRGRYDDLGLDIDRSGSSQASRQPERGRDADRNRKGFEQGGSFSRGQYGPNRYDEPAETGSFFRGNGRAF